MTHAEHSKKAKVSTPCTAQSMTFGGHCLNCGYKTVSTADSTAVRRSYENFRYSPRAGTTIGHADCKKCGRTTVARGADLARHRKVCGW